MRKGHAPFYYILIAFCEKVNFRPTAIQAAPKMIIGNKTDIYYIHIKYGDVILILYPAEIIAPEN